MFSEVAEIVGVAARFGQFQQLLKTQPILILNFYEGPLRLLTVDDVVGKITEFLNALLSTQS